MSRIFLALWPDEPAARRLGSLAVEVAAAAGGRAMPREKIHLTLVFLGEVPDERLGDVRARASAIREEAFEARFDRVGAFRRSGVAWAGMRSMPAALSRLQSGLAASLRGAGFPIEERAFAAHVTLARRITRPVPACDIDPIEWRARDFALVRSETGKGTYSTLESWRLGT